MNFVRDYQLVSYIQRFRITLLCFPYAITWVHSLNSQNSRPSSLGKCVRQSARKIKLKKCQPSTNISTNRKKALKFELVSRFHRIGFLADWHTHVLEVLGFGMTPFLQISERPIVRPFGVLSGACQKGDQMVRL